MKLNRRKFLQLAGLEGMTLAGLDISWPDDGFFNECPESGLPQHLRDHDLVQQAWEGIQPTDFWDCHTHLIGQGDGDSGAWANPDMRSLLHPVQYAQYRMYLNAACVDAGAKGVDLSYVLRLLGLIDEFGPGAKVMLLAFDYHYSPGGRRMTADSAFHTPNEYAHSLAMKHPQRIEWIASIHPYREDAVATLEQAVANGARAVKWLPPAMGMDPASPLCDPFYAALARLRIPLLIHAGDEKAVHGAGRQDFGNPLRVRRALEHGVRVIVAHCASLGSSPDIDKGEGGPKTRNLDLFARLMADRRYDQLLFGGISAITQFNRIPYALETVLAREEWHHRLINGSDYPLPGVMPLFSMREMAKRGYLSEAEGEILTQIRRYNPLLFDFVSKRVIRHNNNRLPAIVFQTRRHFVAETAMG